MLSVVILMLMTEILMLITKIPMVGIFVMSIRRKVFNHLALCSCFFAYDIVG